MTFCVSGKFYTGVLLLLLLLPACSNFETRPPESLSSKHSTAKTSHENLFEGIPTSRLTLLDRSDDGFLARLALIETATTSIDAQYYLWWQEGAGLIYIDRLLAAADRGVKVRLLLDEQLLKESDRELAALDSHKNIEFRFYNPSAAGTERKNAKLLDWVIHLGRLNHRMHNKLIIVDGKAIVIGGRNVGDEYFGAAPAFNFRDLGVLLSGPAVAGATAAFEEYWNCDWVKPISFRFQHTLVASESASYFQSIDKRIAKLNADESYTFPVALSPQAARSQLSRFSSRAVSARAIVVADHPEKKGMFTHDAVTGPAVLDLEFHAKKEVLMVNPYFIPYRWEIEEMNSFVERGGRIRFLTNSMKSNNHAIVHSAYSKARPDVLAAGVELYEVRTDAARRGYHFSSPSASDAALGLHCKSAVFDDNRAFIGTFNYDPRSAVLNTEMGLLIEGKEFVAQVKKTLEADLEPTNSWRVHAHDSGRLRWEGHDAEGTLIHHSNEPGTTAGERFKLKLMGLLPIKGEL